MEGKVSMEWEVSLWVCDIGSVVIGGRADEDSGCRCRRRSAWSVVVCESRRLTMGITSFSTGGKRVSLFDEEEEMDDEESKSWIPLDVSCSLSDGGTEAEAAS